MTEDALRIVCAELAETLVDLQKSGMKVEYVQNVKRRNATWFIFKASERLDEEPSSAS